MRGRRAFLAVGCLALVLASAAREASARKEALLHVSRGQVPNDPARLARIRAAKMPPITKPVMFNTPEADAILAALEVFPPDSPWNEVIADRPVHPNSKNLIASIGPDKSLQYNLDMCFILVPPGQKRVPVISRHEDENYPRMGERFRLRKDFDIGGFSPHVKAILRGLKKYGMFVADNGGDWRLSVAPDARLKGLNELKRIKGRDFEVIVPTGPFDGRRAMYRQPK